MDLIAAGRAMVDAAAMAEKESIDYGNKRIKA